MSNQEKLLVGIVNNNKYLEIIRDQYWFRIPVINANRLIGSSWPPKWIPFYQSGMIKNNPFIIRHYAKISEIKIVARKTLFPDERDNTKTNKKYYKIFFNDLLTLPKPF